MKKNVQSRRLKDRNRPSAIRVLLLSLATVPAALLLSGCMKKNAVAQESTSFAEIKEAQSETVVADGVPEGPAPADAEIQEAVNGGPGSGAEDPFAGKNSLVKNEDGTWTWNGEKYKRNRYVKAILCIGVDRSDDLSQAKETTWGGQADGIFLVAYDTSKERMKIVMIPRDTITEVDQIDEKGNIEQTWLTHLNLAYAWGDGQQVSAKNTVKAASGALCGLEIDHYIAGDMKLIPLVNDQIGGVTVTVPNGELVKADPAWTEGSEILLKGDDAEKFVRYRDTSADGTPVTRMSQHKAYISGFSKKIKEEAEKNTNIVPEIYDTIEKEVVTDLDKGQILKLGLSAAADTEFSEKDIISLPGTVVTREYDEVYLDYNQVIPTILDLFYRKCN